MDQEPEPTNFWFCLVKGCRKPIIESFDIETVKRDHSDHSDLNNFTSFQDSHKRFLAMVRSGDLRPPWLLEQAVQAMADTFIKKVVIHLGQFKETLIKYSIRTQSRNIGHANKNRYELYGALVAQDQLAIMSFKDRIWELTKVDEYMKLQKQLMLQITNCYTQLEQFLNPKGMQQLRCCNSKNSRKLYDLNPQLEQNNELKQQEISELEREKDKPEKQLSLHQYLFGLRIYFRVQVDKPEEKVMPDQNQSYYEEIFVSRDLGKVDWRWDEEKRGQKCVIKGIRVSGMNAQTNCLIAPSFRADQTRTIRLRYYAITNYNVQLVDVATRMQKNNCFDNSVAALQGTYAFSFGSYQHLFVLLDYLDKDTKWSSEGYPKHQLMNCTSQHGEIILTYDGQTKQLSLQNASNNASYFCIKSNLLLKQFYSLGLAYSGILNGSKQQIENKDRFIFTKSA